MSLRRLQYAILVLFALGSLLWLLATPMEHRIFALDAQSGRILWSSALQGDESAVLGASAAHNGRVFVTIGMHSQANGDSRTPWKVIAIDAVSGKTLWEFSPDPTRIGTVRFDSIITPSLAIADTLYAVVLAEQSGGARVRTLVALDAATGIMRWTDTPAPQISERDLQLVQAGAGLVGLVVDSSGRMRCAAMTFRPGPPAGISIPA